MDHELSARTLHRLPGHLHSRGRPSLLAVLLALGVGVVSPSARAAGTWTAAPVNPGVGQAFGLWMLTDGRVISHGKALNNWVVLTPDAKGSYANGKWSNVASSAYARGGAQEHVLKDGRFFEAGGEYIYVWPTGGSSSDYNTVEIYDPIANTWTLEAPGLYGDIGDTGSAVLADGRVFDSTRNSSATQIYDPTTNKWTAAANSPLGSGDENAWATLQNGGILAVGYAKSGAAVYNPATNKWTKTTVPAGWNTGDTAGISQMFDGRVIAYGFGQNYLYTPGATASDAGTWALGPAMLNGDEAEDEFTDTLPNGKVWAGLVTVMFGPGVILQEFDPLTNTVSSATPPPDTGNPYPIGYLNLPNGQVMVTAASRDWLYTPDTPPDDSWRPTVTSVGFDGGTTYTLTGTQISGLINGGDEGDDMTMSQNYPIIWLKDTAGNVYFCRSFNFSNMMPSKGSAPETAQFTTPAGLAAGTYDLYVSAVGVQSKNPFPFTVGVGGTGTGAGGSGAGGGAGTGAGGASSAGAGGVTGNAGAATGGGAAGATSSTGGSGVASGGTTGSGGVGVTGGAAGGLSLVGASGSAATGTGGTTNGNPAGGSDGSNDKGGCACSAVGTPARSTSWLGLGVLGLAALRRRRRR